MNVLVACEYSGIVRDAFIARGHNAISCDLLDTRISGPHIKDDVRKWLDREWDMMICFPPCTYLTNMGNAHWWKAGRYEKMVEALDFVRLLMGQEHIPRIAVENPAGRISTQIRKPDQIVHPYWFGHPYTKRTCLWLKGLPLLQPSDMVTPVGPWVGRYEGHTKQDRSLTFPGIAQAMAKQWG